MKVHLLDEGYAWVPKRRVSPKIQRRRFHEIKDFELERLPTHAITLQEVEILPTLVYSSHFWQKNGSFKFQLDVFRPDERSFTLVKACIIFRKFGSSPRRRKVCLGEGIRPGEGVHPNEGVVCSGKPGSRFCEALVRLGERFFA